MFYYLVMTMRTPLFQPTVIEQHRAFLGQLRKEGKLFLAGPFTDKSGGAYIIKAESLADAKMIAFSDPVYTTQSSNVCVYEWNAKAD